MQLTLLLVTLLLALRPYLPGATASAPRYQPGADILAPYAGTWVGRTATGKFTLVLEERKNFHIGNTPAVDIITGRHAYVTPTGPVVGFPEK